MLVDDTKLTHEYDVLEVDSCRITSNKRNSCARGIGWEIEEQAKGLGGGQELGF